MDAAPTVVPEPGHARPEGAVPDRAGARRAPAAPARAAAARAGPVGAGRRPRAERVPGGGARGAPAVGALPRPAPAAAGVAAGRGGQGRPLRRAARRRALLRAPAAAGAGLVAGARAGAGGRRDRPPRGRGGAGGQRALPRLGDPGRLGGAARQRAGAVAGRHPPLAAPAAAGRAAGLDGAGAGRPGPVEPAPLAAHPPARLAPAAARPAADHDRARRSGALPGRDPGPARRGLGRPRSARPAEGPAPDRHPGRGLDGGAGGALGGGHRPAARPRRGGLVRAAGVGRARLPGPQGPGLAVAALAPDRSRAGRAALAGAGGGQPGGAGARHRGGGPPRARPAAGPPARPARVPGRHPPAPDQPGPAGHPVAAPPARAGAALASPLGRPRALAAAAARTRDHRPRPGSVSYAGYLPLSGVAAGIRYNGRLHTGDLLDFGPRTGEGILTVLPPKLLGSPYPAFVPRTDADGNTVAGIRLPDVAVPVATYTGWNLRAKPPEEGCDHAGMVIPFARTRAERIAAGDPRPSLEERYPDHDTYVRAVRAAADGLRRERLLLDEDAERYVKAAADSDIGR